MVVGRGARAIFDPGYFSFRARRDGMIGKTQAGPCGTQEHGGCTTEMEQTAAGRTLPQRTLRSASANANYQTTALEVR